MTRCLITLDELTPSKTTQGEYSTAGIKRLTGNPKTQMSLPFTRDSFVQEQPARQQGMSISGYQPKLSLVINEQNQFEVTSKVGHYILKPSPEQFPHLAENEHASMLVMKSFGLNTPDFGLSRFQPDQHDNAELSFIIKRFDRLEDGSKLHQEQLDGAMGIEDKYGKNKATGELDVSYERVGQFLVNQINSSMGAKRDFFHRVVLSYVVGNNDLHLRNFGLIAPVDERPRLAPVYDVVSVAPYPGPFMSGYLALPLLIKEEGGEELADGFNTAHGQYIGADFIEFGEGIGLNARAAKKFLLGITQHLQQIEDIYTKSMIPPEHLKAILSCVRHRVALLRVTTVDIV